MGVGRAQKPEKAGFAGAHIFVWDGKRRFALDQVDVVCRWRRRPWRENRQEKARKDGREKQTEEEKVAESMKPTSPG